MDFTSGSSKDLLNEYHRLAADTLLGDGCRTDNAVLEAAEEGQLQRLQSLLTRLPSSVNARCPSSGDTPLIAAVREGHMDVVKLLLKFSADVTAQNDSDESALDVATEAMRKVLLESIHHEDRAMSNAQALLHSAWLGDSVSVKKSLNSGKNYLDVNCRNVDGVTPLLLVTRDISLFDRVQSAMENDYDPVSVMQELIENHADVNMCDKKGRSALHLVASSESIHAKKMVSLLVRNGSVIDSVDDETYSPLHLASRQGHQAIIVALVEGGANVNVKGGGKKDTPLMLSARGGHNETAKYLISKGADVTAIDDNGDTALTVAKTPSMVKLLKEAWVEQTQSDHALHHSSSSSSSPSHSPKSLERTQPFTPSIAVSGPSIGTLSLDELYDRQLDGSPGTLQFTDEDTSPGTPQLADEDKFFLTEGKIRKNSKEGSDYTDSVEPQASKSNHRLPRTQPMFVAVSEAEADDELEADHGSKRVKPAARRAYLRSLLNKRNMEREGRESQKPKAAGAHEGTSLHPNSEQEVLSYSSADEGQFQSGHGARLFRERSQDDSKDVGVASKVSGSPRPSRLTLHRRNDPTTSKSFDSLVSEQRSFPSPRQEKRGSPFLPNVVKSPLVSPLSKVQHRTPTLLEPLPSLTNMHAVAMVSVDTESEKLRVQRFAGKGAARNQEVLKQRRIQDFQGSIPRSKSLLNIKRVNEEQSVYSLLDAGLQFNQKKRNSTGSVAFPRAESKVPLLPNVVTSKFGFGIQGGGVGGGATNNTSKGRGRYLTTSNKNAMMITSPTSPSGKLAPKLSVVNEVNEKGEGPLSKVETFSRSSFGSKDSTLKNSDFEVDSLEQEEVVLLSTNSHHPQTRGEGPVNSTVMEPRLMLPPPPSNPNVVVNYADPHGSAPLSPIWNQFQYFRTESNSSTNSEYITSYIGQETPLPSVLSPDFKTRVLGAPPGRTRKGSSGGNSSDSDPGKELSSGESGEEGGESKDGCLKWKRGKLLGKGAYGKVWEGLLSSARMIAVKEVELDTDSLERAQSQYEKIQAEVGILRSMKHRNIVKYLGTSMQMATVYIFMNYISGGSLQSIIKRFGPLDSDTVSHYTKQITNALSYLHGNGIIHRDIKGANIMVNSRGDIKLIDFGCAKNCEDMASNMHSVRGTPYWMAPEVICGHGYGRKSDIWSLGCTVLEMATTKPPWADYPPEAAMFQIGMGKPIPSLPDHLPKPLTSFFYLCMTREQNERPGASELLQHEFLANHSR